VCIHRGYETEQWKNCRNHRVTKAALRRYKVMSGCGDDLAAELYLKWYRSPLILRPAEYEETGRTTERPALCVDDGGGETLECNGIGGNLGPYIPQNGGKGAD
jgi:hypothetical protein